MRELDWDRVGDGDIADVRGVGGGGFETGGAEWVAVVGEERRHGGGRLRCTAAADLGLGFQWRRRPTWRGSGRQGEEGREGGAAAGWGGGEGAAAGREEEEEAAAG